jgi:hypothetical protein
VPTVGVHHEHLSVKVEKNIERRVTRSRHHI